MPYVELIAIGDETLEGLAGFSRTSSSGLAEPRRAAERPTSSGGCRWPKSEAGDWERAAKHAARAREIAFQYGIEIPQHHLPIAWIAVHRGRLDVAKETSMRARPRRGPVRAAPAVPPCCHRPRRALEWRRFGWRRLARASALESARSRVVRAHQPPLDRRLRRSVARVRPDRRGRRSPRHVGGGRSTTRTTKSPGVRRPVSRTDCRRSRRRRRGDGAPGRVGVARTARPAILSGVRVRSSRWAWCDVAPGRSARRATRSLRHWKASSSSGGR